MKRRVLLLLAAFAWLVSAATVDAPGGELRFQIYGEPKSMHPLSVSDDASMAVQYLTSGSLLRVNRRTQQPEPELAVSWKVLDGGKRIRFELRRNVRFSDGTPFRAGDVAHTLQLLFDPALASPMAQSFQNGSSKAEARVQGDFAVEVVFPAAVANVEKLFDQLPILSAASPKREKTGLGPFLITEYKPGAHVLLERNPHYWKTAPDGQKLPYLDSVRLLIQPNRTTELVRFLRGELHLINSLDPELFEKLREREPASAKRVGQSLGSEMMWFNQKDGAPVEPHKLAWFRNVEFRRAVSEAIGRADLCRVVYRGYATPAAGPVSPSNQFWANANLKPHPHDPRGAIARLVKAGFRHEGGVLKDKDGRPVEFSLITNAGNRSRERMAAMIQQDLKKIGIQVTITTLDFPSLIERIARNYRYEACLLGLVNVELDPMAQMNVWLSSAPNHQWNPGQKQPATSWETEIDRLMRQQASSGDSALRKKAFDRVQQIVWEQAPFLYLLHPEILVAVRPEIAGVQPVVLDPHTFWNAEYLRIGGGKAR